jgi:hypothetical protein
LFIFYDELSSITISFDVYQINYLEWKWTEIFIFNLVLK